MPTVRFPLYQHKSIREDGVDKDSSLINMFPEEDPNGYIYLRTRPGTLVFETEDTEPFGRGRGVFNWDDNLVIAVGTRLFAAIRLFDQQYEAFIAGSTVGSFGFGSNILEQILLDQEEEEEENGEGISGDFVEITDQLEEDQGRVSFTQSATDQLLVLSKNTLVIIDRIGGSIESVTVIDNEEEPDFPEETVYGVVYQDGYTFVMTPKGEIYNSDFEEPESWDSSNFIRTLFEADEGMALTKHLNYIVALGSRSTEFFVNEGLEPPGSPLGRADNVYLPYGCVAAESVWETPQRLTFVARDPSENYIVLSINNTEPEIISNPTIERAISGEGVFASQIRGYGLRILGHEFYIMRLQNRTFVYDFETGYWHEWKLGNSNWPFGVGSAFYLNAHRLQLDENGQIVTFSEDQNSDFEGSPIEGFVRTQEFEGGEGQQGVDGYKNKFLRRLELVSDLNDEEESAEVEIRWSDDDYQTWSNWKKMDLRKRPKLTRLGKFRRRAFEIRFQSPTIIRLRELELTYESGTYGV